MLEILNFFIKHPLLLLLACGVLYRFVWGKYNTKTGESNGEGETYLSPDEQIERAIAIAEKKGKKKIHPIEKKDGFDIYYEEPDDSQTSISIRKKKNERNK